MSWKSLSADDVFISYSRKDANVYAVGLADELTKKGFSCFFDRLGTDANQDLPQTLVKKIKGCAMMVVLGTEGARTSAFVSQEISEFSQANSTSRIVPVYFGTNLTDAGWHSQIVGIAPEVESPEALETGTPSLSVLNRIEKSFQYARSKDRLRKYTLGAATTLLVLVLASIAAAVIAKKQFDQAGAAKVAADTAKGQAETEKRNAEEQRTEAEKQRKVAAEAAKGAELAQARAKTATSEADKQRAAAERASAEAKTQQQRAATERAAAERATAEAKTQKKRAEAEALRAEKEANTAQVQSIARQSLMESDTKRKIHLALDAIEKSKKIDGQINPSAETSLRQAIGNAGGRTLLQVIRGGSTVDDGFGTESQDEERDIQDVRLSHNHKWLVAGLRKGSKRFLHVWDLTSDKLGEGLSGQRRIIETNLKDTPGTYSMVINLSRIAISNDGRWVIAGSPSGDVAHAWDIKSGGAQPKQIDFKQQTDSSSVQRIAISPDNKWVIVNGNLWQLSDEGPVNGKKLSAPSVRLYPFTLFSPDGHWLITEEDGNVDLWDLRSADPATSFKTLLSGDNSQYTYLLISADSRWLTRWGPEDGLQLWDLNSKEKQANLLLQPAVKPSAANDDLRVSITAVDLSPDSRWLGAGTSEGALTLWYLEQPTPREIPLIGFNEEVPGDAEAIAINSIAFSRDSRLVAVGAYNSAIDVWELKDDQRVESYSKFNSSDGPVTYCVFSPDKRWLLTNSSTTHLWDLRARGSSTASITLRGNLSNIGFGQFTDNNRWFISYGEETFGKKLVLWDLDLQDLIALGYEYLQHN